MVVALVGAATVVDAACTNCTAFGSGALTSTTSAIADTAFGSGALATDTTGAQNTATGLDALSANTTGDYNTATGEFALLKNTTGGYNTATGITALWSNTTGNFNTATGGSALYKNTTGVNNTADGFSALNFNTTGGFNTALGQDALLRNTTGNDDTAAGENALGYNTTGNDNVALGFRAGLNLTTGSSNIDIGNEGVKAESDTIRIGTQGTQTATYIAGIFGTHELTKACEVVVEPTGLLGCVKSSVRYKRDIRDMGNASDKLMKLRPVTFRYKADSTDTQEYGLIAEEVEKVYPELVIDDTDGKPETVAYQVLPAMLLNEVQKQFRQLAQKDAQITALQRQIAALQKKNSEIDALAERLDALERQARASRPDRLAAALP